MKIFTFGEFTDHLPYKILNERVMRGSASIMFLLGIIAFINGFILHNYIVISYVSGFLALNFAIGIFINPSFSPTVFISKWMVRKQKVLPIGAIQKRFAWSLGFMLATAIFTTSLFLLNDDTLFEPVCQMCLLCLFLLFFESAFGICFGCKLYNLAINLHLMPEPQEKPNCAGDSCDK